MGLHSYAPVRLTAKIKEQLFPEVPEQYRKNFGRAMFSANISRIRSLAVFTICIELVFVLLSLFICIYVIDSDVLPSTVIVNMIMSLSSLGALAVTSFYKQSACQERPGRPVYADFTFFVVLFIISVIMAYFEVLRNRGLSTTYLPLIAASCFLYTRPKPALFVFAPACAAILAVIIAFLPDRTQVFTHSFNAFVSFIVLYATSRILYSGFVNEYSSRCRLEDKNNELRRINAQLRDVNRQLYSVSNSDPLTGLPNRNHLETYLSQVMSRPHSDCADIGVLMIDIDAFKDYNDALGHTAGDNCLVKIALEIETAAHSHGGFAARYGGEEFVVIIGDCNRERIAKIGFGICRAVESRCWPHPDSPVCGYVTVSIGGAIESPSAEFDTLHIIERADKALYSAKTAGRNRFVFLE